jgi:hypothetical protein
MLHHSVRGSQYSSEQFQRLMADHGVVCSMSRSGNVWDSRDSSWCSPIVVRLTSDERQRPGPSCGRQMLNCAGCLLLILRLFLGKQPRAQRCPCLPELTLAIVEVIVRSAAATSGLAIEVTGPAPLLNVRREAGRYELTQAGRAAAANR